MSEFVPTTEEVRQSFVYAESSEFVATVPGKGNDAWVRVPASGDVKATRVRDGKIQSEATAEFDRWMAALIREAKAEALTEASEHVKRMQFEESWLKLSVEKQSFKADRISIEKWLTERAGEHQEGCEA